MQELEILLQGLARKQCQRLHLARVKASGFYGIVHPQPPSSSQANDIARDDRLRSQILEDSIEIAVQPLLTVLNLDQQSAVWGASSPPSDDPPAGDAPAE